MKTMCYRRCIQV